MTLKQLCELHGLTLAVKYSPVTKKWYATVREMDIVKEENGEVASLVGASTAHVPEMEEALNNLVEKLRGKKVRIKPILSPNRMKVQIPKDLTL